MQRPLLAAGGLPLTLPQLKEAAPAAVAALDAVVLAPGRDMEPERYGQERHPLLAATEPQRDAFELELVTHALGAGLPILGICRGIQVLNVALGGTLAQDVSLIAAGHPSDPGWSHWKRVEESSLAGTPLPPHPRHAIAIAPGSLLERALRTTEIEVNSFHHQAIDRLGRGIAVVATQRRRRRRGDRADGPAGARRAVGAAGGVAGRQPFHGGLRVVRRRGAGAPRRAGRRRPGAGPR